MPAWKYTINISDVWKNENLTFPERRDAIAARIRKSRWHEDNSNVQYLVDELADSETPDEFDGPWSQIYDEADADRIWIKTF